MCTVDCQAILVLNMKDFTPLSYGEYVLPEWSQAVGWLMAIASVGLIPIFAVYQLWRSYQQPRYDGLSFLRVCMHRYIIEDL